MNLRPYARKAQFYETDQMGVIHHARYIHWFEEARTDFMEQIDFGYERVNAAGIDFPLLGVSCAYKSMTRFGDTVNVFVAITELTPLKMTISYRVLDAQTGALRATGESRHCFYHNARKRPVSLEKELPELYHLFAEAAEGAGQRGVLGAPPQTPPKGFIPL